MQGKLGEMGWRDKKKLLKEGVSESVAGVMKGRNVCVHGKRGVRSSILLPLLTYGSETWIWKRTQHSRVFCRSELFERSMS